MCSLSLSLCVCVCVCVCVCGCVHACVRACVRASKRERERERERESEREVERREKIGYFLQVHLCERKEGRRRMSENGNRFWVESRAWLGLMNRNLIAANGFPSVMALKPGSACN